VKLLLDANLSWRLIKQLADDYELVEHVDKINLPVPAKDTEIWDYALKSDFIIATNDEDFLNLSISKGFPPKIILFKTGNQSTSQIVDLFQKHKSQIEDFKQDDTLGVLEVL